MMKIGNVLLAIAITVSAFSVKAQEYKLVWEDNFDGTSIDSTKWNIEQKVGIWNTGDNRELQHYKKENVSVGDDGNGNNCLILTAKKEDYNGYAFTSGKVTTKGKFAFTKGKLEALIKVPNLENGLWPAFWTLGYTPKGWPDCGEIDILEMGHTHAINEGIVNNFIGAHLFWGPYNGGFPNWGTEYTATEDLSQGYFKHTVEWDDSKIAVYFNDATEPYFVMGITGDEFNEFHDFQHYILFNLAVGGAFTGIYNANDITAPIPANMYVDWVKLYQLEGKENSSSNLELHGTFGVYEDEAKVDMRMDLGYDLTENTSGLTPRTEDNAYEGENTLSYNTSSGNEYEIKLSAATVKNMNNYLEGSLQFYIKTDIQNDIKIGVADQNGAEAFLTFNADNEDNFARDGSWQFAYIKLSDIAANIDITQLKDLLIIKGTADADAYVSIDQVLFKETTPAKGYYSILSNNSNITEGYVIDNVDNNIYNWENTVTFNEAYPAYEGENVISFKSSGSAGWFGFGLHANNSYNFSAYTNGYLNVSMRTESNGSFSIGMESEGAIGEVTFNGSNDPYNFERNGEWQHLNIPVSDLGISNLSKIDIVFVVRGASIGNLAIDNVFLSEELPVIENPMVCYASSIAISPGTKTIEVGKEQKFKAEVLNQFGNMHDSKPEWSADGGIIDSEGVFSASTAGTYTITAAQDGVQATASVTVEEATAVNKNAGDHIYAYLANNTLIINGLNTPAEVRIFNASGQLVKQVNNAINTIDMHALASGIYMVHIKTDYKPQTFKIVK